MEIDSKVIKSHQCSLKISHAVSIQLNSEFQPSPIPFWAKADP